MLLKFFYYEKKRVKAFSSEKGKQTPENIILNKIKDLYIKN
jgi:hypothetical protein